MKGVTKQMLCRDKSPLFSKGKVSNDSNDKTEENNKGEMSNSTEDINQARLEKNGLNSIMVKGVRLKFLLVNAKKGR